MTSMPRTTVNSWGFLVHLVSDEKQYSTPKNVLLQIEDYKTCIMHIAILTKYFFSISVQESAKIRFWKGISGCLCSIAVNWRQ